MPIVAIVVLTLVCMYTLSEVRTLKKEVEGFKAAERGEVEKAWN